MSAGLILARLGRKLLIVATMLAAGGAYAQNRQGAPAVWDCWYDGEAAVECRLGAAAPIARPVAAASMDVDIARAEADQPRRPNDGLPQLIAMMHEEPAAFSGRRVSIPLHTVPDDMELVRQLADAVMCGRNRACSIRFAASREQIAMLAPARLPD